MPRAPSSWERQGLGPGAGEQPFPALGLDFWGVLLLMLNGPRGLLHAGKEADRLRDTRGATLACHLGQAGGETVRHELCQSPRQAETCCPRQNLPE